MKHAMMSVWRMFRAQPDGTLNPTTMVIGPKRLVSSPSVLAALDFEAVAEAKRRHLGLPSKSSKTGD